MAQLLIIRGVPAKVNFAPSILYAGQYVSWSTLPVAAELEPGDYEIPEDQRDNLDWFYSVGFRFDKFGRLHVGQIMTANEPETVTVI